MFRKRTKPTYQIRLNSHDESLLEKYADKNHELDQRIKLTTLVDIYNSYYDSNIKSDELALDYSQVLIAYCHFAGLWIPEGRFRFDPPQIITKNKLLEEAKKYEKISESITALLHGDEELARHEDVCDDIDLLEDYKKNCLQQEKEIIYQCLIPINKVFNVANFIPENKYELNINAIDCKIC